jgi:hypothetical protein
MSGEDSTTSPDEIAVLQAYVDLINSEREAIWARHNALLVANSLIIGALAISPTALWENKWAALGMISAGAIISAAWLGITLRGWGMPILRENSPRPTSSICQMRSTRPSAITPRRTFITSSCW